MKFNLTNGRKKDLETIRYFIPNNFNGWSYTDGDRYKKFGYLLEATSKIDKNGQSISRRYYQDDKGKDPIECFFDVSDYGKLEIRCNDLKELNKLREGKRWRGIHIHEMYEQGILGGSVAYFVLLGGFCGEERSWFLRLLGKERFKHDPMPRSVVDFLKREMFKGKDAEIIESVYKLIIN